jgi:hypothetical protein
VLTSTPHVQDYVAGSVYAVMRLSQDWVAKCE